MLGQNDKPAPRFSRSSILTGTGSESKVLGEQMFSCPFLGAKVFYAMEERWSAAVLCDPHELVL
jgi:hypothetical protein